MKLNKQIIKGLAITLFVFFGIAETQAQVTFKPGIRAGANFSHFTKGDYNYNNDISYDPYSPYPVSVQRIDYSSKTDFYIGFYGAIKLTKYYTLQPEIDYSSQGTKVKTDIEQTLNVDYLSFNVINKFTFKNFNVHVGPTLDFLVSKNFNTETNFDMAFILGAGYNFTPNIGIEARVKKGIIPVLYNDFTDSYHTNVVFSVGATYTFDIK